MGSRNDRLYLGLRRSRARGAEYDAFVDRFCTIVREDYPNAFLHFEDFGAFLLPSMCSLRDFVHSFVRS